MDNRVILFRKEAMAARGLSAYGTTRLPVSIASWVIMAFAISLTSILVLFLLFYQVELKTRIGARCIMFAKTGMVLAVPAGATEQIVHAARIEAMPSPARNTDTLVMTGCRATAPGFDQMAIMHAAGREEQLLSCRTGAEKIMRHGLKNQVILSVSKGAMPVWKIILGTLRNHG